MRLSLWLLVIFLVALWIAGGASRADVLGQAVTRVSAWLILVAFALLSPFFDWRRVQSVLIFLGLSVLLLIAQLIPLPPAAWMALPGRELLAQAAQVSGLSQPWRPLSVSPSGTMNALSSLVVPITVVVLAANLNRERHWRVVGMLLILILAGCLLALVQLSRSTFGNPLINFVPGAVSGNFANRNHFALFVALGCLVAPAWGFRGGRRQRWKPIAALAMLPFLLLVLLVTGSRAGLALGAVGLIAGLAIVRREIQAELRSLPPLVAKLTVAGSGLALAIAVLLSVVLGRAVAVDRALDLQAGEDLRARALPYVFEAIATYFPVGAGFGTFDRVYRIVEPDALLQATYFNHAHNDWLEIALDGGAPAIALLLGALVWWAIQSVRAWRSNERDPILPRVGACALLLVLLASLPDYPARTPMIMAIVALAAVWLSPVARPSEAPSPAS